MNIFEPKPTEAEKVSECVAQLNYYRHLYYNEATSEVPDSVYDQLYDELERLEKETGIILSNSPTQTVGYAPVSSLDKVPHTIPLLSLDKTKQVDVLVSMAQKNHALLMCKLDGLTLKLTYEDGKLVAASTRGNGEIGEDVTHNMIAFQNIPVTIPHTQRLVLSGEALIHLNDFEKLTKDLPKDEKGTARNLAAGSSRSYNPAVCKERQLYFYAFNVIEGMEAFGDISDSRSGLLEAMRELGFTVCPFASLNGIYTAEEITDNIDCLRIYAEDKHLPIDGMVLRYDSLSYSNSLGRTGHHYKDGIAFKFEDEAAETIFSSIEWTPSRSGELAPVALFDSVEIDGTIVERASLHNLSFIENLELYPGCRILVSKRNMIIPHIEDNLDRGKASLEMIPKFCPCCGGPTRINARPADNGRIIKTLHCDNPNCKSQILKKFVHFIEEKAMNLVGISEATLEKFIEKGFLKSFKDFYHLDRYRDEIIQMEGFGEKSYEKIQASIEQSRNCGFANYLVAMDIPMIGRTASRALEKHYSGNLLDFEKAAIQRFDFTTIPNFGKAMSTNIHKWFDNPKNLILFRTLQKEFKFSERKEETIMRNNQNTTFAGCTIVATGKLNHFTREGINQKIYEIGATPGSSVTKKTDYLICGEKAGSKLAKAKELGIPVLTEEKFLEMLAS